MPLPFASAAAVVAGAERTVVCERPRAVGFAPVTLTAAVVVVIIINIINIILYNKFLIFFPVVFQ